MSADVSVEHLAVLDGDWFEAIAAAGRAPDEPAIGTPPPALPQLAPPPPTSPTLAGPPAPRPRLTQPPAADLVAGGSSTLPHTDGATRARSADVWSDEPRDTDAWLVEFPHDEPRLAYCCPRCAAVETADAFVDSIPVRLPVTVDADCDDLWSADLADRIGPACPIRLHRAAGPPPEQIAAGVPLYRGSTETGHVRGYGPPASSYQPEPLDDVLDDLAAGIAGSEPTMLRRDDGVALLYPAATHIVFGPTESGKSWLCQHAAAAVLLAGGRVLYLDHESDRRAVVGRLLTLDATPDAIRARFAYVRPDASPAGDPGFDALLSQRWDLAVVDGVTAALRLTGAASKEGDDVTAWWHLVPQPLADRTGAAVVCIDHPTKTDDPQGRYPGGSPAKIANVTGAAYRVDVDRPLRRGRVGRLRMSVTKDRPGIVRAHAGAHAAVAPVADVVFDARDEHRVRVALEPPRKTPQIAEDGSAADGAQFRPTAVMRRVHEHLSACGDAGDVVRGIRESARAKHPTIVEALDALTAAGYLAETSEPRRGRRYRVTGEALPDDD